MSRSAPDPHHGPGPGPGHLEDVVLPVTPLSAQEVLGPAPSALPEGTVPRDGTRGRTRGPVLPHLVDGSVLSLPHLPVNASLVLVARSVIVAVHLPAEGGTRQKIVLDHVAGALATGQVGAVRVRPLHGAEGGASLGLLHRKVGGAEAAQAIAAAVLVVNLPVAETAWTPIVVG
jgi:hypothetical protein